MQDALKFTGEDQHVMGVTVVDGTKVFVYDRDALMEGRCKLWMEDDPTLTKQEAWSGVLEDYLFNTACAWVGETTPVCIDTDMDEEVAADLFDGELGPSPSGSCGFLGVAERPGLDACYAFDVESDYRPVEGQTVIYVDTDVDLSKWLD